MLDFWGSVNWGSLNWPNNGCKCSKRPLPLDLFPHHPQAPQWSQMVVSLAPEENSLSFQADTMWWWRWWSKDRWYYKSPGFWVRSLSEVLRYGECAPRIQTSKRSYFSVIVKLKAHYLCNLNVLMEICIVLPPHHSPSQSLLHHYQNHHPLHYHFLLRALQSPLHK